MNRGEDRLGDRLGEMGVGVESLDDLFDGQVTQKKRREKRKKKKENSI